MGGYTSVIVAQSKTAEGSSYLEAVFVVLKFNIERRDYCYALKSNKSATVGVEGLEIV